MSSIDYSSNESYQEQDTVEWTAHLVKQLSAYTTWINSHLKKRAGSRQIHDLKLDIRDGVALIQLVELLSGEHLGGTVYPQSYHDMRENVQRVIDFMQRRRIRMHQTQASDIVEGNIKSIMRLILAVAVHYQPDSVKQSAHQQVRNQHNSQQSSSSEDRRNVDPRSRRNDVIRPEESHSDYANVDPRTFAGHTPAYVPNQYPRQGSKDPRVDPRVHYDPRMSSYDPRETQRELRDPRDPRFDNFYDNRQFRNVPYETDLDRRTPTDFLDHNQGSRENITDYPQNSRRDNRRGSKDNLDYREKRNSRENLDWRENLRSRDQVDGRNYHQAPRQVTQRRSRSREQLDQSDSESDNRAPRVRRSRAAEDPRATQDPRPTQDPRATQDSRYVVPWRVEPRGWSEKVRNVRAGGMVKSRSLDFDNVSSEESHSETSSAASAPRSVSIQPLTSTRVPNTPTSYYQSNQTTPSNYHSNVIHGTPDDGLDTPTNLATPIKGTPVKGTNAPVTSFASSRGPVIPYNPVVPYAPVVPSLDSTRAPQTPNAPAPSLASTGAHNTPVDAVTSSLRHNDGGRVAPNTTMVQCTAPNTTMAEYDGAESGAMFGEHSGSSEGAMSDAMMNLLDNLDVDHSNMAGDLTETKQMLISLQSLLLDGDCDEMMPLQPGDEISPKEEMIILKNRLIQSEVSSQSLQDQVDLLKAENQRLLQEKTTLEQKLHDQAEIGVQSQGQGQGQGHDNESAERNELLKQVDQKDTAIKELKRDLSYKDRLIQQLQSDLETEIQDKETVSRQLKQQLTVLQEKMTRVGQSEAEISSKLANQDQAMNRIEGRMTSQRNNNQQDPSYQEDLDHARELVRGLRSALSRYDPHHKAVDGLDGALASLGRQMALMQVASSGQGRKMSDPARRPLDQSEEPRCSPVAAVQGFPVAPHYHSAKPYHPIPPRQYHDVTSTTQMTSQSSRGDVMSNVSKMSSSIKSAASNPNLSGQSYTSPNLTMQSHMTSSHANLTSSSKGMKSMMSAGSVTSSTQSVTSSSHTKILYFTESTVTPFLCTIPKRLGEITLSDFKAVYDKPGKFRYHFKSMDPEFGTVKEEISADEDILPGWEGKVVAWIEEDQS